jgi:hypothetical protein
MADNTIIQQGTFVSNGLVRNIPLRSDVDWMHVWNATQMAIGTINTGVHFYWQRGMAVGTGFIDWHAAATQVLSNNVMAAPTGFTLINTSIPTLGAAVATTNVTAALPPLVLTGNTQGMVTNDGHVIRLYNVAGGQQFGGIDFSVGAIVNNTSIALAYSPQPIAALAGNYRIVNTNPLFYPRRRVPTIITQAVNAVVTTSVQHDYTVGQQVRFKIPAAWGMIELNGLTGTIVAINPVVGVGNNTLTVDIDTTGFTPFAFPLTAAAPFTPAEIIPVGEDITYTNLLDDATTNISYIGMQLAAGALSPAGLNNEVIYWQAGKSFSI